MLARRSLKSVCFFLVLIAITGYLIMATSHSAPKENLSPQSPNQGVPQAIPITAIPITQDGPTPTPTPPPPSPTPTPTPGVMIDLSKFGTDHFFTEPFNKSKCAILYLIKNNHLDRSVVGIHSTFHHFNDYYNYPVLFLYEKKNFNVTRAKELYSQRLSGAQMALIEFVELELAPVPSDFNFTAEKQAGIVWEWAFPGYQQMCTFWFKQSFDHPRLRNLTYYMRLDTDGYIISNFTRDPFQMMYEKKLVYATRAHSGEPESVTHDMIPFLRDYTKDRIPVNDLGLKSPNVEQFYNNFEIVHVPAFSQDHVKHFYEEVNRTYNVYRWRWGDGPLRYYATRLFFRNDRMFSYCGFHYNHSPRYFKIADGCPEADQGVVGLVKHNPTSPPPSMPRFRGMKWQKNKKRNLQQRKLYNGPQK
jgi:hypothetical protein